jgi:hypothetical protein
MVILCESGLNRFKVEEQERADQTTVFANRNAEFDELIGREVDEREREREREGVKQVVPAEGSGW